MDAGVDAEPLYASNLTLAGSAHNVLFVVTENDSVYAFDADTFTQLWHVSVLGANETASDNRGCGQVSPIIGITSTPVIDLSAGTHGKIFLVAMSLDNNGNYHQRLHALDLTTGTEISGSPVNVQATFPTTSGTTTFDPKQYKERAALLLSERGDLYHLGFALRRWTVSGMDHGLQRNDARAIERAKRDAQWQRGRDLDGR